MFGHQFYPTPSALASRMLEPYKDILRGAAVLDPSAGKGDLLDACRYSYASKLYAIEIDQNLRDLLRGKKINLIGEDFLQYEGNYWFDLCVMNPPFDNGAKHLLKAWHSVKARNFVCILNAETIRNPFSTERELLAQIIEDNGGTVEFIQDAFVTAERKTSVEVALVRLEKKATKSLAFDGLTTGASDHGAQFEFEQNSLPTNMDVVDTMLNDYQRAADALARTVTAASELHTVTKDFWGGGIDAPHYKKPDANERDQYNDYLDRLRQAAWNQIFTRTKIRNILTTKARADFEQFQRDNGVVEFTRANIVAFFNMILSSRNEILQRCVLEVFDMLTSFDKKNRIHIEGWVTNDYYQVNKKVILPLLSVDKFRGSTSIRVSHYYYDSITDIDRAFCFLSGIQSTSDEFTSLFKAIENAIQSYNLESSSTFFHVKCYKKGTVHIEFRDLDLLARFNQEACKGKGWIAEEYTKSHRKTRKQAA